MIHLSELSWANLIVNCSAVLLLIGIMLHTRIFRKRGGQDDRLYFLMTVITMVMAVSDILTYVMDSSTFALAPSISYFFNSVYYVIFELLPAFFVLYLIVRRNPGKPLSLKKGILICLPAIAAVGMIIANWFGRFLFTVDPIEGSYTSEALYSLIYVMPVFYGVVALVLIFLLDKRVLWLYLVLILVKIFVGRFLWDVSSTALLFAMGLTFAHIHVMGKPMEPIRREERA